MERRSLVPFVDWGLPSLDLWQSWMDRAFGRGMVVPWRPSVDVYTREGSFVVEVELAGLDPEKDVEVSVEEDFLVITGEKSREHEVAEEDRYLLERSYGRFERRIPLPEGADADAVSALYDKGVLRVSVPLRAEAEHPKRKVPVTRT